MGSEIGFRKAERGATLVEGVAILFVLVGALTYSFSTISLYAAKLWLEHSLYQAAKCELQNQTRCREKFRQHTELLSWGRLTHLSLVTRLDRRQYKFTEGQVTWCNQHKTLYDRQSMNNCTKNKLHLTILLKERMWSRDLSP